MKTRIEKSYRGEWIADSYQDVNGQTFEISTQKSGNTLRTTCYPVQLGGDSSMSVVSFDFSDIMNKKTLVLQKACARVTELSITKHHGEALIRFDEMVKNGEIKGASADYLRKPEIGHILFTDSNEHYPHEEGNEFVLYEIEQTKWGVNYKTVELTTNELRIIQHPKNWKEKFGIGNYFKDDYRFAGTQDELNNMIIEGVRKKAELEERLQAAHEKNVKEKNDAIERGKQILQIPEWAKAVIVARLYQDESDSMTDYFSTSVERIVILGFSRTDRHNLNELLKFTGNFEHTKDLTEQQRNNGGYYLPEYYIGTERWSGWKVTKDKWLINDKNTMYELAGRGEIALGEPEIQSEKRAM